ncbi:MAG: NAD(P)-dependent oxidoreductase [Acutalibacteraceae bacterium]|nr:NAD(P)-dependent oxidoreductase [Acutalibacteraceae bacterium]
MKIGFIGLGIMGESMCENIVKKHNDTVYCNDHKENQIKKLESFGAVGCKTNAEIAEKSDIIITMIPTSAHVKTAYIEMLPYLKSGKICIDMSTIEPSVSVEVAEFVKATGAQFADCPVVRSKADAIAGTLGVLVGCDKNLFTVIEPILSYMGSKVIYMGENGKGISAKICHNTLVAEIQNGVNETLILAQKLGISIDNFADAVAAGGAQNFYMNAQREKLKNEDWSTAFSMENMRKDITICAAISEKENFDMPGMRAAKAALDKGFEKGWGKEDFRKTYKIVRGDE